MLGITKAAVLEKSLRCQVVLCFVPEDTKFEEYQNKELQKGAVLAQGILLYELRLFGAMEKITRRPWRHGGRARCVGAEPRHEPPASTQGAQGETGGHTGTRGRTLQEGVLPCTHPSTLSCSIAPKLGKDPVPGAQADAPTSPRHAATEVTLLSARSPRGLRCPSKTFHHHRVPIHSTSPSPLAAAARPDTHQGEGLFAFR